MSLIDKTAEFTLEQRDAVSRAFSAGNYANAYDTRSLVKALVTFARGHGVKHHEHARAAFVLGFFSTYALHEIIGSDRADFDRAYRSPAGRYVVNVAKYTDDRTAEYETDSKRVP